VDVELDDDVPFIDIAAYGMNQLRLTCAMKRRSTTELDTLVSNWISDELAAAATWLSNDSPCV